MIKQIRNFTQLPSHTISNTINKITINDYIFDWLVSKNYFIVKKNKI